MATDLIRLAERLRRRKHIILLLIAITVVGCGGPEERKAMYRARAHEYMEAANYPKARVALRNLLKIDPKDADAYYLFAKVEEREKNWRNAVQLYQEAVRLVPDHTDALLMLAKYYLEARLTDPVVEAADKVLKKDPHHPRAMALKIAAQAANEDHGSVIPKAEAVAIRFPTEPDVAVLLATLYGQQRRYRDAEAALRRALVAHPKDMDLLDNLNTILVEAKDLAGAEGVIRQMIDAEPAAFDHRVRLARLFDSQGAPGKAEAVLRDAVALDPHHEQRRLMLADFLATRNDFAAAERALLEAVDQIPRSTQIQFGLAALYRKSGEREKARERYLSMAKEHQRKPAGLEAEVKLAELDLDTGNLTEAERRLHDVLEENPRSSDGLILSGRMALARRNGKDAVQAFRTVLHDRPEMATVHYLLGQAYQVTGETGLARESFERAIALYPAQLDARRSLAVLESQRGRHEQARARLDDLLKQRPDDLTALDMLMTLDLVTKNWNEAERTLAKLRALAGDGYVTAMAEGRFHEAQHRVSEASRAYERAAVLAPNEPEPLLSLIKLQVAQGRTVEAKQRLESLVSANPGHMFAHGLLGEVLSLAHDYQGAILHFREAVRLNQKWTTPWLNWATLELSRKKPDLAIPVLESGLKSNPTNEELHMLLAAAYSEHGRVDHAMAAYERALRINPRNWLAANNLAALLVDHKGDPPSLEKAFALSRDFEKEVPHPLFIDTLGWVRFKMGHQEEAIRLMKQAVAKSPDIPVLNYHLGMALFQAGKPMEARTYLSKSVKTANPFQGKEEAEQVLAQLRG